MTKFLAFWASLPAPVHYVFWLVVAWGLLQLVSSAGPKAPGLIGKFFTWLSTPIQLIKSPMVKSILQRLADLLQTQVLALQATALADIQTQIVDGKLDPAKVPDALLKVETDVVAQVKQLANAQGLLHVALYLVFGGDASALDQWLKATTQAHIQTTISANTK